MALEVESSGTDANMENGSQARTRAKEKGMTEDEMAGGHHRLDGHGFG